MVHCGANLETSEVLIICAEFSNFKVLFRLCWRLLVYSVAFLSILSQLTCLLVPLISCRLRHHRMSHCSFNAADLDRLCCCQHFIFDSHFHWLLNLLHWLVFAITSESYLARRNLHWAWLFWRHFYLFRRRFDWLGGSSTSVVECNRSEILFAHLFIRISRTEKFSSIC